MSVMLAALHNGAGAFEPKQIARPKLGAGEALVRVRAAGICGSDLLIYNDSKTPETLPAGHEVAGEVVELGKGVKGVRVGERVAVEGIGEGRACGDCYFCRTGQWVRCLNRAPSSGGGFAQYMVRLARACHPLPDSLSWEEGALVEPLAVSIHGLRRGDMRGGETVAVLGAGNIGLTGVAAARALGAGRVFATARHPHQRTMALRLGADAVFSPEGDGMAKAVAEATGGLGADLVLETVGGYTPATIEQAIAVARPQGRIVVLGGFRKPLTLDLLPPLLREQSIIFANCYAVMDGRHEFDMAIEMIALKRAPVKQMVTHRFPLERIQEAFSAAYDKSSGSIKVQLFP